MKIYKSWIFDSQNGVNWDEPTKYFFNEEQAKQDNENRVKEFEKNNPNCWLHYGVDEIEVH